MGVTTKEVGCPPHYWIISPPNGRTSRGRCKLCGKEKRFPNYIQRNMRSDMDNSRNYHADAKNKIDANMMHIEE